MAENKNKDKELQKTDKDDSLKSIKTSKPVSKNTKPSSEFKKSKETKSIDSKSVVSKNVDSKESKKIYHKIIKTNLLKILMARKLKMIQIMTKKIFIRKNPKVL